MSAFESFSVETKRVLYIEARYLRRSGSESASHSRSASSMRDPLRFWIAVAASCCAFVILPSMSSLSATLLWIELGNVADRSLGPGARSPIVGGVYPAPRLSVDGVEPAKRAPIEPLHAVFRDLVGQILGCT